jgi:hypothetical protein
MESNTVCFIHSCNINITGTEKLDYLLDYINKLGLLKSFKHIFINNIGAKLNEAKYKSISENIVVINFSSDNNLFENCTLRQLYFFSQYNPDYKILYLHTKGVSYKKDHKFFEGIQCWINYMLYCLVNKYKECVKMLDYVDVVGCQYKNFPYESNPSHFSGNFWWTTSNYIKTNSTFSLKNKYDAEFWLFKNNPYFINICKYPFAKYETPCYENDYSDLITNNISTIIYNLENPDKIKILYGTEGSYIDVTDICKQKLSSNGIVNIPPFDLQRSIIFENNIEPHTTDKHILIGNIKYNQDVNVMFKIL